MRKLFTAILIAALAFAVPVTSVNATSSTPKITRKVTKKKKTVRRKRKTKKRSAKKKYTKKKTTKNVPEKKEETSYYGLSTDASGNIQIIPPSIGTDATEQPPSEDGTQAQPEETQFTMDSVTAAVGDGSYVKLVSGKYAYLYVDSSGQLQTMHDVWFDGRYFEADGTVSKGTTLSSAIASKKSIVILNPVIRVNGEPQPQTGFVTYYYDQSKKVWIASDIYDLIENPDDDTADDCAISLKEARKMGVDANTKTDPLSGISYSGLVAPGMPFMN